MKKPENLFRIAYDRVYDYFTFNLVRRIFFFSLCTLLIFSIAMQIFQDSWFVTFALLLSAVVCAGASMIDSFISKRMFVNQMRALEADYAQRIFDKEGEEGLAQMKSIFVRGELRYIRKKKREYNYMIIFKFILVVILVAVAVTML